MIAIESRVTELANHHRRGESAVSAGEHPQERVIANDAVGESVARRGIERANVVCVMSNVSLILYCSTPSMMEMDIHPSNFSNLLNGRNNLTLRLRRLLISNIHLPT
jgi:hypothetical protein